MAIILERATSSCGLISSPTFNYTRLTLCVSGAAPFTQTTIRNSLRGLRCTHLLGAWLVAARFHHFLLSRCLLVVPSRPLLSFASKYIRVYDTRTESKYLHILFRSKNHSVGVFRGDATYQISLNWWHSLPAAWWVLAYLSIHNTELRTRVR